MLPTFVIGLREGLEAALIVGIVAAFLRQRGRKDLLRLVWIGVGVAIGLCAIVGIGLKVLSAELPTRQQEGLETVVGLVAVAMVTYMVVWMKRNSRGLKKQLEGAADAAIVSGGGGALVFMAFLAVLREGFETAVFLLAAFNQSASPVASGGGAALGILVAVLLGYGIYRGGVRINLSKFFRATGLVLVLVAAGLLVSAAHTAHEAGWLNAGQGRTLDLTWLVHPGSVQSSLLTGMLGWQPRPVAAELIVWLVYLIPVGLYVAWPPGRPAPARKLAIGGACVAVVCLVAGLGALLWSPDKPAVAATESMPYSTSLAGVLASGAKPVDQVAAVSASRRGNGQVTVVDTVGGTRQTWTGRIVSTTQHDGRAADQVEATGSAPAPSGLPATLTLAQAATANGGRLPLGVNSGTERPTVPVTYTTTVTATVWLDESTGRVLDLGRSTVTVATAKFASVTSALAEPVRSVTMTATAKGKATAAATARHDVATTERRSLVQHLGGGLLVAAAAAAAVCAVFGVGRLRRRPWAIPSKSAPSPRPGIRAMTGVSARR